MTSVIKDPKLLPIGGLSATTGACKEIACWMRFGGGVPAGGVAEALVARYGTKDPKMC